MTTAGDAAMGMHIDTLLAIQLAWQRADSMWLWGLLMMVVWVALIAAVSLLLVTPTGREDTAPTRRARTIIAESDAQGELSTEEYRERLDALR